MPIPDSDNLPSWIQANVPEELVTSSLFRFKVSLQVPDSDDPSKRKEIEVDILPDLDIDMEILENQMQDIPSQYVFWASVYSELRLAVSLAERKLKQRKSEAFKAVQDELVANNIRVPVEQQKMAVEMDKNLCRADVNLAVAQRNAGKIWHMLKALEMKHEVCRSLIGFKKSEHDRS